MLMYLQYLRPSTPHFLTRCTYILTTLALFYTHYFGIFITFFQIVWILLLRKQRQLKRQLKRYFLDIFITCLGSLPWINLLWKHYSLYSSGSDHFTWIQVPSLTSITRVLFSLSNDSYILFCLFFISIASSLVLMKTYTKTDWKISFHTYWSKKLF